ncbi:MAG: ATP synthase F1 subunit delta [Candidatus Hydrogenedentota bacterium]|nr:MAG: ATP synthase F1 subunit delta [Candidatus Hydrogenedentota bacterium]
MRYSLLARRYARALADATDCRSDLPKLEPILPRIERRLQLPLLNERELLDLLSGLHLDPITRNLLRLLCKKKRHALLPEILAAYHEIAEERAGIRRAEITTAVPISDEKKKLIENLVRSLSGAKRVSLATAEDPEIIGGLILKIGDTLLDGSVRSKLAAFRQTALE